MHDFWSRRVIVRRKDDRQNAPLKDWFPKMPSSFDALSKCGIGLARTRHPSGGSVLLEL